MILQGSIVSLQIGKPQNEAFSGMNMKTAIKKQKTEMADLGANGFSGDGVGNPVHHGGPERAVCFYPAEHYSLWEEEFQKTIAMPAFGENLTVHGMKEEEVCIGDIFRIGRSAAVQVTQGRVPCSTISFFNNEPQFLKRILDTCYTGYFAKMIDAGTINQNDNITLLHRAQKPITVLQASRILLHQEGGLAAAEELISAEGLAEDWKKKLKKRLS
ncbi:MOSC domain-containing protein YiiM [Bacillus sp. OV322]|uniref:MOSC domain-containing protein n=1 Tax=Bacillus sp. OV322 TaxID=1882764 RepID=UPI0008E69873|nr:MOSC domain-containing protein [Bacillus sp. OV322]SFC77604.1 MOSC domain-containing protein YiiM [Bacillus sp. OV322]